MATRTKCWEPKCMGVPFAVNDGASRIAEGYFGRIHYQCDTCKARWSVTPEFMSKDLGKARPRKQSTRGKTFEQVWNTTPNANGAFRSR